MRTLARFVIYTGGMLAGLLAMYRGVNEFLISGEMDERKLLAYLLVGIVLVFAATEVSERLKDK